MRIRPTRLACFTFALSPPPVEAIQIEQEAENQAAAEIIAAADSAASPNGFGSTVDQAPGVTANPAVLLGAAFAIGFLLAKLARRRGA
jgi:hypothetical protein